MSYLSYFKITCEDSSFLVKSQSFVHLQVASGEVDMAIGGDQGGSIRLPAAWSGIVGLKPTFGLVPYTGAMGLDMSIDHLGPMAKTVLDCATLLEVRSQFVLCVIGSPFLALVNWLWSILGYGHQKKFPLESRPV